MAQPKSGQASGHLGVVLEAHTFHQPAALASQRAVRLDPKDFTWRYCLALCLEEDCQLGEALAPASAGLFC